MGFFRVGQKSRLSIQVGSLCSIGNVPTRKEFRVRLLGLAPNRVESAKNSEERGKTQAGTGADGDGQRRSERLEQEASADLNDQRRPGDDDGRRELHQLRENRDHARREARTAGGLRECHDCDRPALRDLVEVREQFDLVVIVVQDPTLE